uniref:Exosome complex component 10 n=1 Tax=Salmo trutta TaxID=8032 RepID=A0A674CZP7_SALTR
MLVLPIKSNGEEEKPRVVASCHSHVQKLEMDSSNSNKQNNNQSLNEDPAGVDNEFYPGFKDVDAFVKYGLGTVVAATKASASLPQVGDEYDLYRSFPGFQEFCETQGDGLLHCMSQIMHHHGCRAHMRDRNKLTGLEERFDLVVDANDVILEKVGILLDDAAGVNRSQQPVMPAGFQPPKIVVSSWNRKGSVATFRLLQAKNVTRPQLKFREKVDNSNTPFTPKIIVKPNARKPLPSYFTNKHIRKERPEDLDVPAALADFIHQQRTQEHVEDMFAHPYQYELDHLALPENLLSKPEPQMYKPLAETKCSFIDNLEDLVAVNEKLTKTSEFAVDLEHHSYRSFLGITCLMQISTRDEDFIIDTLELRSELYILNEAFTDPAIVKVFHGADSDIEWLQKDLGLYIVNMFDTHQASRTLNLGRHSLDHLLKLFCNVDSDKRYQLADWRIRPLPDEMFQYARADTHYLLYVYDRLRVDLWEVGNGQPALLQMVWHKSKDISLKKYMKPLFTDDSYMDLLRKQKKAFNTQQLTAFRLLYGWRDKLARQEDESTGYVLPNHMMIKISDILPKEPQGIIACCNPVPPLVRQQINELHILVQQAREMPLLKVRHPEIPLFGPHDTSRVSESDIPKLSTKKGALFSDEEQGEEVDMHKMMGLVVSAKIALFEEDTVKDPGHLTVAQQKACRVVESFQNPFRMYLPSNDIHISKNAKFDPSTKIYEISNRWKLQSVEQQQKEVEAKKKAKEEAKAVAGKFSLHCLHFHQESIKPGGTKRERVASETGESTPKPNKKLMKAAEKKNEDSTPPLVFKPYDYSQSDFKVFAGTQPHVFVYVLSDFGHDICSWLMRLFCISTHDLPFSLYVVK